MPDPNDRFGANAFFQHMVLPVARDFDERVLQMVDEPMITPEALERLRAIERAAAALILTSSPANCTGARYAARRECYEALRTALWIKPRDSR